jgi:hypothetical protein
MSILSQEIVSIPVDPRRTERTQIRVTHMSGIDYDVIAFEKLLPNALYSSARREAPRFSAEWKDLMSHLLPARSRKSISRGPTYHEAGHKATTLKFEDYLPFFETGWGNSHSMIRISNQGAVGFSRTIIPRCRFCLAN